MFWYHEKIEQKEISKDILLQELGHGENMNVLHWNMADGSVVKLHTHSQEQFGYVIKGGFEMVVGEEKASLEAGDCYFIAPDVPHSFVAVGDTEAIDVFTPIKRDFPWKE